MRRCGTDPDVAEAAITVVDDWQNKGLGTLLLLRLVAAARERGIRRFESRALADNAALRDVLAPLGPVVTMRREGDEVVIELELPDVPNDALYDASARQAAHHRVLSLIARGTIAVRKALENLEKLRSCFVDGAGMASASPGWGPDRTADWRTHVVFPSIIHFGSPS
jgi:hypothetical protein